MITNPRSNMHKKQKTNMNKIAINIGTNILNIFNYYKSLSL